MPALTLNIPANVIPELQAAADELLDIRKIDRTALTPIQRVQRYFAEIAKDVVISRRRTVAAATTAQQAIDAAVTTATTDAGGIV